MERLEIAGLVAISLAKIAGNSANHQYGGLVGYNLGGNISNSWASGR